MKYEDLKTNMILADKDDPRTVVFFTWKNDKSARADIYDFTNTGSSFLQRNFFIDKDYWSKRPQMFLTLTTIENLPQLSRRGLIERIMRTKEFVIENRGG
jgi:hypothetical protein